MPALGPFARRIAFNRRETQRLRRMIKRLHLEAADIGQLAATARANGHIPRSKRLLNRALEIKAEADEARLSAQRHRQRIVQLQSTHKLNAQEAAAKKLAAKSVIQRREQI